MSAWSRAGNTEQFEARLLNATYWLSGTFFFSSAMNYVLAKWIVISPAGSEAFNAELGRMNLLSYPMIAIPSMIMLMAIFYYLWRTIHGLTGLKLEDVMANARTGQAALSPSGRCSAKHRPEQHDADALRLPGPVYFGSGRRHAAAAAIGKRAGRPAAQHGLLALGAAGSCQPR